MHRLCGARILKSRSLSALQNRAKSVLGNRRSTQRIRRPSAQGRRSIIEARQQGLQSKSRRQQRINCVKNRDQVVIKGRPRSLVLAEICMRSKTLSQEKLFCNRFDCSKTINKTTTSSKQVFLVGFPKKSVNLCCFFISVFIPLHMNC